MEFEYDRRKSESNKQKHGIDFEEAKKLWEVGFIEVEGKCEDEQRFILVGKLDKEFYSCIFTKRGERIRIISCRRSREGEEKAYHEFYQETSG